MAAFGHGAALPSDLSYLAEIAAFHDMGFVASFEDYLSLPVMVLEDMRMMAHMRAEAQKYK
jgi:predicted NBD/HSP70 family sugar kinase